MRVVCVKWGSRYGPEWVLRLRAMCARHLPRHEFLCVTDAPVDGVECWPLVCDLPGWWQKVGLLQPGLFRGETLYLDLDVVITRPFSLPDPGDKLWALDDFSYSLRKPRASLDAQALRLLGGLGTVNSSVMWWRGDAGTDAWRAFHPGVMEELHGDQNHITRSLWPHKIGLLDGVACSYKYHILRGQKPAPVVVFHGKPKMTDLSRNDPLRQAWECAA